MDQIALMTSNLYKDSKNKEFYSLKEMLSVHDMLIFHYVMPLWMFLERCTSMLMVAVMNRSVVLDPFPWKQF